MRTCSFVLLSLSLAACGGESKPENVAAPAPAVAAAVLKADPGAAVPVLQAKKDGPKDSVVVTGRIAKVVPGFAVMTLMDSSLPYCGEKASGDDCRTPWDYCCESSDTQREHALLVEVRDADGKPIATPSLPDLRLLDLVKVRGKLEKDPQGNLVLVADGLFRQSRPELPDYVEWP